MRALVLIAALALGGCVPKAQYVQLQQENARLKDRVERLDARAEQALKSYRELMADLKPLIDRGIVKLEVVDGRITLAMPSDVLFASGSAELSASGKANIADLTAILKNKVNDRDFQVDGHTDNEPINTAQFPSNWHLGAARAIAVTEFMISRGFPEDHLSAASYADNSPVATNGSEAGRAQNRRIEIVVVPDLTEMPGYRKLMQEQEQKGRARGRKNKR